MWSEELLDPCKCGYLHRQFRLRERDRKKKEREKEEEEEFMRLKQQGKGIKREPPSQCRVSYWFNVFAWEESLFASWCAFLSNISMLFVIHSYPESRVVAIRLQNIFFAMWPQQIPLKYFVYSLLHDGLMSIDLPCMLTMTNISLLLDYIMLPNVGWIHFKKEGQKFKRT